MDELLQELREWEAKLALYSDTAYGVQLTPVDACNLGGVIEEARQTIEELRRFAQ